jgi:hypothetical protein
MNRYYTGALLNIAEIQYVGRWNMQSPAAKAYGDGTLAVFVTFCRQKVN